MDLPPPSLRKRICLNCCSRNFRNLALVDVIDTLPVLWIVKIDIGDRTFDRRSLRQERFRENKNRDVRSAALAFNARARPTDRLSAWPTTRMFCFAASSTIASYDFGLQKSRDLDEVVTILFRLDDGLSCFGFGGYDVALLDFLPVNCGLAA